MMYFDECRCRRVVWSFPIVSVLRCDVCGRTLVDVDLRVDGISDVFFVDAADVGEAVLVLTCVVLTVFEVGSSTYTSTLDQKRILDRPYICRS